LEEPKPKEKQKPTYQDILKMFLEKEGIKAKEEEVDTRPNVDELSP